MAAINLPKGSLMKWNGNNITEHNRSELNISVKRIENSQRMANGTMRKYVVADKREFSCSWEMIPDATSKTVDGKWGGSAIESFYNTTSGSFVLTLTDGAGVVTTYNVMFTDFSKVINKRGAYDAWNIDITLEEV
jgi:hypothetical protein